MIGDDKVMRLNLRRFLYEEDTTLGYLMVNDKFECWTLEDKVRDVKIKGQTAIPIGIYRIEIRQSPHFGRLMPYLVDVPNYKDVMLHWGLKKEDTEGCPLVAGDLDSPSMLKNGTSKIAFDKLFIPIQKTFDAGEDIFISVEDYIRPM